MWPYVTNLHRAMPGHPAVTAAILVLASVLAGMVVGFERERKDKPAGLRTLTLISTGSTIFTLASLYAGEALHSDGTRIAAQIVTGIGFLGAGAIIRERGRIIGLTTGATIWVIAAIGMLIGMGYAAAGVLLAGIVVVTLTATKGLERAVLGPCRLRRCRVVFDPDRGKTRLRIQRVLDGYKVPADTWQFTREGDTDVLDIRYCTNHPQHRLVMGKLAAMGHVREMQIEPAAQARG